MRNSWLKTAILLFTLGAIGQSIAAAQAGAVKAISQTDVGFSVYGAYSGRTTGNGIEQSPSNAAGGIIEVRHIRNPLIGYEGTYSFNGDNQVYSPQITCGIPCGSDVPAAISAHAHEFTGDWIASLKVANLRPFALAGGGLLFNQPSSGSQFSTSSTKGGFVYGGGLDWGLVPHIGLRFQYRGNLYRAPDLSTVYSSSGAFVHTAEPMIGVYLRL